MRAGENGLFLALEPEVAESLTRAVVDRVSEVEQRGEQGVLVCSSHLRPALRKLVRSVLPHVAVLSYGELGPQLNVETVGTVSLGTANV
jgi:flagellar biosynthesis protein FlhA